MAVVPSLYREDTRIQRGSHHHCRAEEASRVPQAPCAHLPACQDRLSGLPGDQEGQAPGLALVSGRAAGSPYSQASNQAWFPAPTARERKPQPWPWKTAARTQKVKHGYTGPSNPASGCTAHTGGLKAGPEERSAHPRSSLTTAKRWKRPKSPSTQERINKT